jgi:cell division transport system ATP-binding protein
MPAPRIDRPGLDFAENQACIGSCHLPCCRQNLNRRLTTRKPSFGFGSKRPPAAFAAQVSSLLIRFENVGLRYGMGPEILRDISFQIPERSFQFLSGPSGAGKTTLLRLLFLSLRPTRGLITVFGKDRARISRHELPMLRRRIGVVFQDFRLLEHMTTYDNVALPLRVRGREEASYKNDVTELLKWVGLGERMHVLPPVLSGGEKQRAAIARALIEQPEILLADEPTGNVDPPLARRLLRLFIELNRLGTAVVIATHDVGLMEQVDARRMILSGGRLDIYD